MIATPHLVIGAIIGVKFKFLPLVILFAFLSHYLLDYLPHADYLVENIKKKKWKKSGLDFLKLTLDLGAGLILIMFIHYFTKANYFILFTAAFFAILPDLTVLNWFCPNNKILEYHSNFHEKIHYSKNPAPDEEISVWTKIFTQLLIILIGFLLL